MVAGEGVVCGVTRRNARHHHLNLGEESPVLDVDGKGIVAEGVVVFGGDDYAAVIKGLEVLAATFGRVIPAEGHAFSLLVPLAAVVFNHEVGIAPIVGVVPDADLVATGPAALYLGSGGRRVCAEVGYRDVDLEINGDAA